MNAVFVYTHLGPHMYAWVDSCRDLFQCSVVEVCDSQAIYPWVQTKASHKPHTTLFKNRELTTIGPAEMTHALMGAIERLQPTILFTGRYDLKAIRTAAAWARTKTIPSILMMDSWKGSKRRWRAAELAKRFALRRMYDAAVVAGEQSGHYARSLGFGDARIWTGIDVVDNEFFSQACRTVDAQAEDLRQRHSLPANYFLCVARHAPEKNLPMLLRAYSQYRKLGGGWDLMLLGTGPQSEALGNEVKRLKLEKAVHFMGWIGYQELPIYYRLAKAAVLPSAQEPWGLTINEALACGKPVLVSTACGCVPELVHRGVNGHTFDPIDSNALADLFNRYSSGDLDLNAMGESSARIVESFTLRTRASALYDCVQTLAPQH